jgi:hypothetical protein
MFSHRLLSLVMVLAAGAAARATETWETAATRLQAHVEARLGHGAIIQLERVDARTVRIKMKAAWPDFRGASFQSAGEPGLRPLSWQVEGRPGDPFQHTATIDPRATRLEVRLYGSDFNPKLLLRVPSLGQSEVGTVLLGQTPTAG